MQLYIDHCIVAGVTRTKAGCDAIGKAIRENEIMVNAWKFDTRLLQKTVTEYAQSAMRAIYHNVPFTQGLKNNADMKIPDINGNVKGTNPKAGGKVQTTTIKALLETLQKAMDQCSLLNLDSIRGAVLDVCFEVNPKFKQAK
jgi:hypothetical protein